MRFRPTPLAFAALVAAAPAHAHGIGGTLGGFISGFAHPILEPDHVVAMVAVGLWGAFLGRPAIFLLPIVFPLVMAAGGVLGMLGARPPAIEAGVATSAIVLGMMVALAVRLPLWAAAVLVGLFAIFHGLAHGTEIRPGDDALAYSVGFVLATGLLHLAGIAFGLLARWPVGRLAVRAAGCVIALIGVAYLSGLA